MASQQKPKDFRKTKEYRRLKQAMLDNLAARGLDHDVYIDKVEEYMNLWVLQQKLDSDIDQRGLTVTDDRGRQAENRSISATSAATTMNAGTAAGIRTD